MAVVRLFQIATPQSPPAVFVRFLQKLARMINIKKCEHIFLNFALKIFREFLQFYISSRAV